MAADLYRTVDGGVEVAVHAQPSAGRSAVVGRHGDALKVKVAAPPHEGRANTALAGVLAEAFGVPEASVSLVSGASSRTKRFLVAGVDGPAAASTIERLVAVSSPQGSAADPRRR